MSDLISPDEFNAMKEGEKSEYWINVLMKDREKWLKATTMVACRHEAYLGYCVHCNAKLVDGIAVTPLPPKITGGE